MLKRKELVRNVAWTEIELSVGEFRFRARIDGPANGELVILLHGFPQTSWEWRYQLGALASAGYRAVAPDQRGYSPGARPIGVDHYDQRLLARDVLGMADALGVDRFHLVGHDFGAVVGWVTAIEYPERLQSLAAISVGHPNAFARALNDPATDQAERSAYISLLIEAGELRLRGQAGGVGLRRGFEVTGLADEDVDEHVGVLLQPGALEAALSWYRAFDFGLGGFDDVVDVPTLFIWSTGDTACGRDGAVWTADYVRAPYHFAVVDNVCHWVPETAPNHVNALLLEHLAKWQ